MLFRALPLFESPYDIMDRWSSTALARSIADVRAWSVGLALKKTSGASMIVSAPQELLDGVGHSRSTPQSSSLGASLKNLYASSAFGGSDPSIERWGKTCKRQTGRTDKPAQGSGLPSRERCSERRPRTADLFDAHDSSCGTLLGPRLNEKLNAEERKMQRVCPCMLNYLPDRTALDRAH